MDEIRVAAEGAGNIGLPDTYRDALGVVQDNEIRVVTMAEALRRIQQMVLDKIPPERSLSEELARERREEAARE